MSKLNFPVRISQEIFNPQAVIRSFLTRKRPLNIIFTDTQKNFKEQAGFCKVSFRQYDEEVCDILEYGKKY